MNKISAFFSPGGAGANTLQRLKQSLGISTTPGAKPQRQAERPNATPSASVARKIQISEIFHHRLVEAECFYDMCLLDAGASEKLFAACPEIREFPITDDRAYGRVLAALPKRPGRQTTAAELVEAFGYNPCAGLTDGLHPSWALEQMRDAAFVCRLNLQALTTFVSNHPRAFLK